MPVQGASEGGAEEEHLLPGPEPWVSVLAT